MISGKNAARKPTAGVNEAKIKYYLIFQHFCFTTKAYLGSMISGKKRVIEPTVGVNEANICPKIAENC